VSRAFVPFLADNGEFIAPDHCVTHKNYNLRRRSFASHSAVWAWVAAGLVAAGPQTRYEVCQHLL
jgi:hypothetical protein